MCALGFSPPAGLRSVSPAMLPVAVNVTPGFFSLLQTLERQKMSVDSMKRPLMMAALNGLYVARMPVPENPAEEGAKSATDERVRTRVLFISPMVSRRSC